MLKIVVLNGSKQGSEFNLTDGLLIEPSEKHKNSVVISELKESLAFAFDSSGSASASSLSKMKTIDFGGEMVAKLDLLPGLIFSIGDVGFSVQEGEAALPDETIDLSKIWNENLKTPEALYPLESPIKIEFVRGALLNSEIEINWHPYKMGAKSTLHHFVDENINIDDEILSVEQSIETDNADTLIRPFISNFIYVNKHPISKPTIVNTGDLVEFSNTAFYIRIP